MPNEKEAAEVRRLFEEAAACGNRYDCPPADELNARAQKSGEDVIPTVALGLMTDPTVRSFDRLGTVAYETARSWASSRVKAGTFDAGAQQMLQNAISQILKADSSTFVVPVYALLSGPIGQALPGTRELLAAEAINPKRDQDEVDHVASVLRGYTRDLSQVRAWLSGASPKEMWAGVALLNHVDHSVIDQHGDELPMLLAAANRRDMPSDVALALVDHVKSHADDAFLPVLRKFGDHPDADVRRAANAATDAVKRAVAERAARAPS
jgi:hypothetical protein